MRRPMFRTSIRCLLMIVLLGLAGVPAHAGSTIYSSLAAFETAVGGGSYSEISTHLQYYGLLPSTISFSSGDYSYTVASAADSGLWALEVGTSNEVWLSTN